MDVQVNGIPDAVAVARGIALQKSKKGDDDAFLVFDGSRVDRQMAEWRRLLPRVRPFYAVKCNDDAALLRRLADLGAGFDSASRGEIDAALALSVPPGDIVYANPCKSTNAIRYAAEVGVALSTFDSEDALEQMTKLQPNVRLLLRISVQDETATSKFNEKFGCDPEKEAESLLQRAAELQLRVIGISFHVGSGSRDPATFHLAIKHCRRLFDIGQKCGHSMQTVDIGGGFPGFPKKEITFEQIAEVINAALDQYFPTAGNGDGEITVMAEPGRFFAATAYHLCCNVIARTTLAASRITQQDTDEHSKGFKYYINDSIYGTFGNLVFGKYEPAPKPLFPKSTKAGVYWSRIWGQTCDGMDMIKQKCRLPELKEGDWLLFENMGAYSIVAGCTFNGFQLPQIHRCPA